MTVYVSAFQCLSMCECVWVNAYVDMGVAVLEMIMLYVTAFMISFFLSLGVISDVIIKYTFSLSFFLNT